MGGQTLVRHNRHCRRLPAQPSDTIAVHGSFRGDQKIVLSQTMEVNAKGQTIREYFADSGGIVQYGECAGSGRREKRGAGPAPLIITTRPSCPPWRWRRCRLQRPHDSHHVHGGEGAGERRASGAAAAAAAAQEPPSPACPPAPGPLLRDPPPVRPGACVRPQLGTTAATTPLPAPAAPAQNYTYDATGNPLSRSFAQVPGAGNGAGSRPGSCGS